VLESGFGPTLPTWALQQVVGYLRYIGRDANAVAKAARDPKQTFGPDQPSMLKSTLSLAASIHRSRISDGINIVTAEFGRTLAKYRRLHEAE
jgi:hypothetical protein